MTTEFNQLNLHPDLVETVAELGYQTPTPIQAAVIPAMLNGQDVNGQAQTGTGKTAAFALPIIHNLDSDQPGVQALVVVPTRELAKQVAKALYNYGRQRDVSVLCCHRGKVYPIARLDLAQKREIRTDNGCNLAVAAGDGFAQDNDRFSVSGDLNGSRYHAF